MLLKKFATRFITSLALLVFFFILFFIVSQRVNDLSVDLLFETEYINHAKTATITSSAVVSSDFPLSNLTDGDIYTHWSSGAFPVVTLTFDLLQPKQIDYIRINIQQFPSEIQSKHIIYTGTNLDNFKIAETLTYFGENYSWININKNFGQIRFIKIETIETDSFVAFNEIEFYTIDKVSFNFNQEIKDFIGKSVNFIATVNSDTPQSDYDAFVKQLNLKWIRSGWSLKDYDELVDSGTKFIRIIFPNGFDFSIFKNENEFNLEAIKEFVRNRMNLYPRTIWDKIIWEPFNEPNYGYGEVSIIEDLGGLENFTNIWNEIVSEIKIQQFDAKIMGPSFSMDRSKLDYWDNFFNFILLAKNSNTLPNYLSYHEGYAHKIVSDSVNVENFLINNSVNVEKIVLGEYMEYTGVLFKNNNFYKHQRPGNILDFLVEIEKSNIDFGIKSCWWEGEDIFTPENECLNQTITGLLTNDTKQPRNKWFLYKYFSDLNGRIISGKFSENSGKNGIAVKNESDGTLEIMIGRTDDRIGNFNLEISNIGQDQDLVVSDIKLIQFHCNNDSIDCKSDSTNPHKIINQPVTLSNLKLNRMNDRIEILINFLQEWDVLYIKFNYQDNQLFQTSTCKTDFTLVCGIDGQTYQRFDACKNNIEIECLGACPCNLNLDSQEIKATPTPISCPLMSDLNGDGSINSQDETIYIRKYGISCYNSINSQTTPTPTSTLQTNNSRTRSIF